MEEPQEGLAPPEFSRLPDTGACTLFGPWETARLCGYLTGRQPSEPWLQGEEAIPTSSCCLSPHQEQEQEVDLSAQGDRPPVQNLCLTGPKSLA